VKGNEKSSTIFRNISFFNMKISKLNNYLTYMTYNHLKHVKLGTNENPMKIINVLIF